MTHNYFNLPDHPYKGLFIMLEGPDGSGKSTQYRRLNDELKKKYQITETREPGGTPVGEKIREVLLARVQPGGDMDITTEMLLYQASRVELMEKRILPALRIGEIVSSDRGPYSTYAYQGTAGNVPRNHIDALTHITMKDIRPDIVLLYDLDEVSAAKRLSPLLDRMEAKGAEFHNKVRQGYLQLAKEDRAIKVIDASKDLELVWKDTWSTIETWMNEHPEKMANILRAEKHT